ncbi:MAG: hypothetical protein ACI4IX_02340 [Acutalibacteraceae bacterium]
MNKKKAADNAKKIADKKAKANAESLKAKQKEEKIKAKAQKKETASQNKKPVKGIIIAAAALVLAAAVILTGIFVVKPKIDSGKATTVPIVTEPNTNKSQYTYADYKGAKMPVEFVEILNQAAIDSKAAGKKYGVAVTIGDREVSMPEFEMYYYDEFHVQLNDVNNAISEKGYNGTGFDTSKLPDEQKYPADTSMTWADVFTVNIINQMTATFEGFDQALKEGIDFSAIEIAATITHYERIKSYASSRGVTPDERLADVYAPGLTYNMFCAKEIMVAYAEKYYSVKHEKLENSYTQQQLDAELKENRDDYTRIIGRVYPIEGDYVASEVNAIRSEKDFINYANNNYPGGEYNAEVVTSCNYSDKETISTVFGDEVADWMFSEDRVAGEITVIETQFYAYVVYIKKPAFLSTSREIISYDAPYYSDYDDDAKQNAKEEAEAFNQKWEESDKSEQTFRKLCSDAGASGECAVFSTYYYYQVTDWIYDESRKKGDYKYFDTEEGCYLIYYLGENTDDYEWPFTARTKLAKEDYQNLYDEIVKSDYPSKENSSVIKKAQSRANVVIKQYMEEQSSKAAEAQ